MTRNGRDLRDRVRPTGGHLIHRKGGSHDGAIVINPTTASPTYLLFHFTNQSY